MQIGVTVIILGNELDEQGSNPRCGYLWFTTH